MSFGFSIGDFVAASQLARSLYKDVYLIAQGAPTKVRNLQSEIANLSQAISFLGEEICNPNSTLRQAGQTRVGTVNTMMKQITEILEDLQNVVRKHDLGLAGGEKAKIQRVWDKVKFANGELALDDLRAKVQYHNGLLNLLLTVAGNSSLKRLEASNQRIKVSVSSISQKITDLYAPQTPLLSMVDQQTPFSLSKVFMEDAERVHSWVAIGFDEWIRAGNWWLLKSQTYLYSDPGADQTTPIQAYTDLLKASWILIDIVSKHPQLQFWSTTGENLKIELLAQGLKEEFDRIRRTGLKKPGLRLFEKADLRIWLDFSLPVALTPNGENKTSFGGANSWETSGENLKILFRG
ncbi:MAG: hypothetical protein M1834_002125 [Cirrosporium novae-zelandiae]|nr:MAG: hypothetical protein M1834_002125 [Cirrosporium novae-zelandiae]